jgi:DNA-binding transcriptional ArsR family regulator
MKRWTIVFRAMANINRLKIIEMLSSVRTKNVGEIAEVLDISFKATSNHLAILKNLDVLDSVGSDGHVFYSLNQKMPSDLKRVVSLFLK